MIELVMTEKYFFFIKNVKNVNENKKMTKNSPLKINVRALTRIKRINFFVQ